MGFHKLDRAKAAANISSLGVPAKSIKALTESWFQRQREHSLENIMSGQSLFNVLDNLGTDNFGRMFITFRFSAYLYLYRALAERSPTRTVASLIGFQAEDNQVSFRELARAFDFDIRFIQSGSTMIRSLRSSIAEGVPGVIILGNPWSKGKSPADIRYDAPGGRFHGLSTIDRLVGTIDPNYEMLTARRDLGDLSLSRHAVGSLAEAFNCIGARINADPADYELLHKLHSFFDFSFPSTAVISFRMQGQRYGIHARSMRAWKLPGNPMLDSLEDDEEGICHDEAILDRVNEAMKERVDLIVSI